MKKTFIIIAIGIMSSLSVHAQQFIPLGKIGTDANAPIVPAMDVGVDNEHPMMAFMESQHTGEDNDLQRTVDSAAHHFSKGSSQNVISDNNLKANENDARASVVYIQNETVTGSKTYTGTVIKVGSDVTDSKAHGPVNFNGGAITINGSEIQIYPQTTISNTTTFKLVIN